MPKSTASGEAPASKRVTRSSTSKTAAGKKSTPTTQPKTSTTEKPKPNPSRKRKLTESTADEDTDKDVNEGKGSQPVKKAKSKKTAEKRQKTFRKEAPKTFLDKLQRAQTQRMIVIGRTRGGTADCPTEAIDIVGTTGNIYTVTINSLPTCTCPDSRFSGNECKHKVYALATVLRAPYNLQYQRALLSTELKTIFENAPPIPTDVADEEDKDGTRKPIEGECPICYMDFEADKNEIVWCKAGCGQNMHKTCFDRWAASQRGNTVKCVYCRTPWEMDNKGLATVKQQGTVNRNGYINVADQFGMSGERDYSSYHPYWVRQQMDRDWDEDE